MKKLIVLIMLIAWPAWALDIDVDNNNATDVEYGGTNANDASTALINLGAESSTSNDFDPDRLAGDTTDDDLIDEALLPDLSGTYEPAGTNIPLATVEAAGDIIVGSGAATVTRIAKGANNTLFGVNNSGTLGFYDTITTVYAASFDSDDSYSGTVTALTAGESIAQWDVVYIKNKSGVAAAYKYDADGADKTYPPIAVAVAAVSADASGTFMTQGFVRNDGWGFTTNQDEGKKVYASTTAGAITLTEPSNAVIVGTVIEEGVVHFSFSPTSISLGNTAGLTPWKSFYVHPGAFRVDGTNCAAVAAAQVNSGPYIYSTACSDAAGTIQFQVVMPENWDGGNLFIEPSVFSTQASPSGTIEFEVSIQARGNDETINNTWVTTNGNIYFEDAETSATTVDTQYDLFKSRNKTAMAAAGAGGDILFVLLTRDNDDATHDTSTQSISVAGVKVFYQVDSLNEKD